MSGPPAWVREAHPAASGWVSDGVRRWRARLPGLLGGEVDLLVLVNAEGTRAGHYALNLDDVGAGVTDVADGAAERVYETLQGRLDDEALPTCEAPGCAEKAPAELVVDEPGTLAGVPREVGDRVRFCWPHGDDVRRAGYGLDAIAVWLRPDARLRDPLDLLDAARDPVSADILSRSRVRLVRVAQPAEAPA